MKSSEEVHLSSELFFVVVKRIGIAFSDASSFGICIAFSDASSFGIGIAFSDASSCIQGILP